MRKIRYRDKSGGTTRDSLQRAKKHLGRLGAITEIRGVRWTSVRSAMNPQTPYKGQHEAVLIRGPKGTMRFEGVRWGYFGEGCRGLSQILQACGLSKDAADAIANNTDRKDEDGIDFSIKFPTPIPVNPDVIKTY